MYVYERDMDNYKFSPVKEFYTQKVLITEFSHMKETRT